MTTITRFSALQIVSVRGLLVGDMRAWWSGGVGGGGIYVFCLCWPADNDRTVR